jgi:hypothetical protein
VGLIGSGVVIHVPSFFKELDALDEKGGLLPGLICFNDDRRTGLNCSGRIFISDRAHLVFDFHQIVDGLKEVELGGSRYGGLLFVVIITKYVSASEPRRKGLARLTLGKLPVQASECITFLIMIPLRKSSVRS